MKAPTKVKRVPPLPLNVAARRNVNHLFLSRLMGNTVTLLLIIQPTLTHQKGAQSPMGQREYRRKRRPVILKTHHLECN